MNTYTDAVAYSEHKLAQYLTDADRLVLRTSLAGGERINRWLLIGAEVGIESSSTALQAAG